MVKQCAAPLRDKWEAAARSALKLQCVKHCQLAAHNKIGQKPLCALPITTRAAIWLKSTQNQISSSKTIPICALKG